MNGRQAEDESCAAGCLTPDHQWLDRCWLLQSVQHCKGDLRVQRAPSMALKLMIGSISPYCLNWNCMCQLMLKVFHYLIILHDGINKRKLE